MKELIIILNIIIWIGVLYFLFSQNLLPWIGWVIFLLALNNKEIIGGISFAIYGYKQLNKYKAYIRKEEIRKKKKESNDLVKKAFY